MAPGKACADGCAVSYGSAPENKRIRAYPQSIPADEGQADDPRQNFHILLHTDAPYRDDPGAASTIIHGGLTAHQHQSQGGRIS